MSNRNGKVVVQSELGENYIANGGFVIEHFAVVEEMRVKAWVSFFEEAEKFYSAT
jgi:hypothetical protein